MKLYLYLKKDLKKEQKPIKVYYSNGLDDGKDMVFTDRTRLFQVADEFNK